MKHLLVVVSIALGCVTALCAPLQGEAQESEENPALEQTSTYEYQVGQITDITQETDDVSLQRAIGVDITSGQDKGKHVLIDYIFASDEELGQYAIGNRVIVYTSFGGESLQYFLAGHYRVPHMLWLLGICAVLVITLARWRGVFAFLGLALSCAVILGIMVPQILAGRDPFIVSTLCALGILYVSLFMAHGLKPRIGIAALGMSVTIVFAISVAYLVVSYMQLHGVGSEEAYLLQFGLRDTIYMKGVLLGGIVIGVLGVLDDVATAQVAAVEELYRANHKLHFRELYLRGFSIGKEHIISLINTLALAYAGASLPLFLLFSVSNNPWWVTLSSEPIAEELARTFVGSIALIVAVPLTTLFAALFYSRSWFRRLITED